MGTCDPKCTKTMLSYYGSINVTGATLHAHFLGKTLKLAQYRNGKFIRFLAKDDVFSYNNPTTTRYNPPVILSPGDELRTTCVYDTTKRKTTTYYGDGTYDEMCFGFVQYYPKIHADLQELCLSYERCVLIFAACPSCAMNTLHPYFSHQKTQNDFSLLFFTSFERIFSISNIVSPPPF